MNKKGQALIEFIIIMPILLMILLAIFDYGKILSSKLEMENYMDMIVNSEEYNLPKNIKLETKNIDNGYIYSLNSKVDLTCPVLIKILSSSYDIEIERIVYE